MCFMGEKNGWTNLKRFSRAKAIYLVYILPCPDNNSWTLWNLLAPFQVLTCSCCTVYTPIRIISDGQLRRILNFLLLWVLLTKKATSRNRSLQLTDRKAAWNSWPTNIAPQMLLFPKWLLLLLRKMQRWNIWWRTALREVSKIRFFQERV